MRILGKNTLLFDLGRGSFGPSMHHLGRQKLHGSRLGRAGSADLFFRSGALGLARPNLLLCTALVKLPMGQSCRGRSHTSKKAGAGSLFFRSAALGLARPKSLNGATLVDLPMARIFGGFFHTTGKAADLKRWES